MAGDLLRGSALLTAAALLLLVGLFLWRVNVALRNAFRHRESYAENLRRAGRGAEADQVEAATRALARRLPLYGKILVAAALLLGILGLIRI